MRSVRTLFPALAATLVLQFAALSQASAQTFDDVPPNHWAASFIEIVAGAGVSSGCGSGFYCPDAAVTRAQMAVFLERGMRGGNYIPAAATGSVFFDVGAADFAANFIEQLAADGITAGCGNGNYCPGTVVTRDQMAVFLLRAKHGASYSPPAPAGVFADVDQGHWAAAWIEQLAAEGVTAGCGSGNFCPADSVTRAQMAVFLVRTFNLSNPGPGPYVGPAAANVSVLGFQQEFWSNTRAADRCGGCHNDTVGQLPLFVRNDDVNLAYGEALTVIDTGSPSASRIVEKVGLGHNCWVVDPAVCAATMTTWIENWLGDGAAFVLNGSATDMPLANASISATVFDAGGGGNTSTVFSTTADGQGAYSLAISTQNADDFVVLQAEGVDTQQGAVLVSHAGSSSLLGNQADTGTSVIDVTDHGALEISHASTALAALAEQANGGPIYSQSDLADAESRVNSSEFFTMASVIKTFVDNAAVSLPAGIDDTLELVRNQFEYSGFVADIEANFASEFAAAMLGVAESLNQQYASADLPGTLYLVARDNEPLSRSGLVLDLNVDNTGEAILFNGSSNATWTIDVDGQIVIDLLDPPQREHFPINPDPNSPNPQVRALESTQRITVARLADGTSFDQVTVLQQLLTEYPDNPELPDEVVDETIDETRIFMAFRTAATDPFAANDVGGSTIAVSTFHQGNNIPSSIDPRFGAELLTFNGGGSGITSRSLRTFIWTIDPDGAVVVRFANGDENRIVRFSQDGIASHTLIVGDLGDGTTSVSNSELVVSDGVSEFSDVMLLNRRYRSLAAVVADDMDAFDFLHLPGGDGCRIVIIDGQQSFADIDWWSTAANTMDSWRYHSIDPSVPLQRRAWELVAIETGQFGDRYWLVENLETNSNFDPAYSWLDPATTPGRLNAYEFIQDLSGQTDPCGP